MLNDYGIKSYPAEPKPVRRFLFLVLILTLTVIGLLVLIWWLGRREIR